MKKEVTRLRKLLDMQLYQLLEAEKEIGGKLTEWLKPDLYQPLALMVRDYHILVTTHTNVIKTILKQADSDPVRLPAASTRYVLAEAELQLNRCGNREVWAACLVSHLQLLMHHKISAYGTAAAFAWALGLEDMAGELHVLVGDEKFYDHTLSHIAKQELNRKAIAPEEQHK